MSTSSVEVKVESKVEAARKNNKSRVSHLFNVAVATLHRGGLTVFVCVFEEQVVVLMPPHTFSFIITCLLAFAEIKSQGNNKFPFETHPRAVIVSLTTLVIYAFASAAEPVIYAAGFNHTCVYAIIARLGRLGALFILVASLLSLFCF